MNKMNNKRIEAIIVIIRVIIRANKHCEYASKNENERYAWTECVKEWIYATLVDSQRCPTQHL